MPRTSGSPNKNKRGMKALLKQQFGADFDVIHMLAENCVTLHEIALSHRGEGAITMGDNGLIDATSSAKEAVVALDKLAQYVEPKLKAVEIEGQIDLVAHEQWLANLE